MRKVATPAPSLVRIDPGGGLGRDGGFARGLLFGHVGQRLDRGATRARAIAALAALDAEAATLTRATERKSGDRLLEENLRQPPGERRRRGDPFAQAQRPDRRGGVAGRDTPLIDWHGSDVSPGDPAPPIGTLSLGERIAAPAALADIAVPAPQPPLARDQSLTDRQWLARIYLDQDRGGGSGRDRGAGGDRGSHRPRPRRRRQCAHAPRPPPPRRPRRYSRPSAAASPRA
jgi:hypothetical protein